MERSLVVDLYVEGVGAVGDIATQFEAADWNKPACGAWAAEELARHLVGVVTWYGEWLTRSVAGDRSKPFSADEFKSRNAAAIAELGHLDGPAAIAQFTNDAHDYLDRARQHWDEPYGFPLGTATVGLHLGIAATEWHLHAWDFAAAVQRSHSPAQPEALFVAAGEGFAATKPRIPRAVIQRLVPVGARRSPWESLLRKSGRTPK